MNPLTFLLIVLIKEIAKGRLIALSLYLQSNVAVIAFHRIHETTYLSFSTSMRKGRAEYFNFVEGTGVGKVGP